MTSFIDSSPIAKARFSQTALAFIVCASVILMVTMGMRQSVGLFVEPVVLATGMGIDWVSFAMALGQVMWGFAQPIAGMMAERIGARMVAFLGLLSLGLGLLSLWLLPNSIGVFLTFGFLTGIGAGFASLALFLGALNGLIPDERVPSVSGWLNAASSMGQFVFAPLVQLFLTQWAWYVAASVLGVVVLAALPMLYGIASNRAASHQRPESCCTPAVLAPKVGIGQALGSESYLLLHLGFFTCGFHIAFLVTHLPGNVSMCGLPMNVASVALAVIGAANVVGSLWVGRLCQRYPMQNILGTLYLLRVLAVVAYLFAPKTEWTWYVFAAVLGSTWLATVPPTAGLVGGLFGMRNITTLFGLTMLSHQIGAFLGAYLGGLAVKLSHSYDWMWWADAALAAIAAVASFKVVVHKDQQATNA